MNRVFLKGIAFILSIFINPLAHAATPGLAIVLQDQSALRSAARDSAKPHAVLWQGEVLEVRGERLDYLQVYEHRRERAGFVRASQARRLSLTPEEAPELLAVVRHPAKRRRRRSPRTSTSPRATASPSSAASTTGACSSATTATPSGACWRCARVPSSARARRSR